MKILHVYKSYYPHTFGGIEKFIDTLCENTSKQGVFNELLTTAPCDKPFSDHSDSYLIKNYYPATIEKFSCPISFSLLKYFKQKASDFDLIHYHFPWPFADLLNLLTQIKKPYIITYHSDIIRQKLLMPVYSPLMKHFLSRADKIIATSDNYVKSSEILKNFPKNVGVIPIGLDDRLSDSASAEKTEKPYFLFMGVLRNYKGLQFLVEAMRGVSNYNLIIAGGGPCYDELKTLIEHYQLTNIQLLGRVTEEKKHVLYQNAYGVVSSAHLRNEAYCYMLVEGLMFGKPLISTEINTGTSFVNVDKKTGLVVSPGDPAALRTAMNTLFANKSLDAEYASNARARFLELFTADKMTEAYVNQYRKIIGERK
ncbi:MAG: glycosyltransferase [Gammaproteobacteria bacterium]|nr:glycosyltransferase [Gammaproteobacteria bacterium]